MYFIGYNDLLFLGITIAGIVILGFFIYFNDRTSVTNQTFLKFSLVTAFWGLFNYLNYKISNEYLVLQFIRLVMFFAVFQSYFFLKLVYVFPDREFVKINKKIQRTIFFIVLFVALFTLTPWVFSGVKKSMNNLVYQPVVEPGIALFALVTIFMVVCGFLVLLKKYRISSDIKAKNQFALIFFGTVIMFTLIIFFNFISTAIFKNTYFIPYGATFVLPFIFTTFYAIYKHQLFNMKVASVGLIAFVLTIFSFFNIIYAKTVGQIVLNATFFIVILGGNILLIKTILKEVEQKEYLQVLNKELKDLIKQRENLVHLITHKVKGSFTRSKYIFAEMVDGSFGHVDGMLMKMAKTGLDSDNEGIHTVDLVLNAFNLGSGLVKYDMKQLNLKDVVAEVLGDKGGRAHDKGLIINLEASDPEYKVKGDPIWLKEVVNNFIENSIRYSTHGTINITLTKKDGKVLLSVKDDGVGLSDEDKKGLFTEGGRGKESLKMNVDSTGYGLFSVKVIVEAHGGRVWAESEGRDKGSTFYAELPEIA